MYSHSYESSSGPEESGEFDDLECGIGIEVKQQKGQYQVSFISENSSAQRTGLLQVGDVILSVEGISVFGKKQHEVLDLLYGPVDTLVELEIEHGGTPGKRSNVVVRRTKNDEGGSMPGTPTSNDCTLSDEGTVCSSKGKEEGSRKGRLENAEVSENAVREISSDFIEEDQIVTASPEKHGVVDEGENSWDPEDSQSEHRENGKEDVGPEGKECVQCQAWSLINQQLRRENERLREENTLLKSEMRSLAEERSSLLKKKSFAMSEVSLDPSEFVFQMNDDEAELDGDKGVGFSEESFDPSEMGSLPDGEDQDKNRDRCGIGITLHVDDEGTFRIISITHGGPADLSGDVLVGDVVTSVDNTPVQGMKKPDVIRMLKGPAGTKVQLELRRQDEQHTVEIERDEAQQRVWKVLSQYSELHPEDFDDLDNIQDVSGRGAAESMKLQLQQKMEEIKMLEEQLVEAERGKEGMLDRINSLLTRAQESDTSTGARQNVVDASRQEDSQLNKTNSEDHRAAGCGKSACQSAGVGLVLWHEGPPATYRVKEMREKSPSQMSRQVQINDILLTVDSIAIRDMAETDVIDLLDGEPGTPVILGLQRVNSQGLLYVTYVSLTRSKEAGPSVAESRIKSDDILSSSSAQTSSSMRCSVGLLVRKDSRGNLRVRGFAPGGPADRCGRIQVGHILVQVDGKGVRGLHYNQLSELFLGSPGSTVELVFQEGHGADSNIFRVQLQRDAGLEGGYSRSSRRMETAKDVDPIAAENAVKNAQASAAFRSRLTPRWGRQAGGDSSLPGHDANGLRIELEEDGNFRIVGFEDDREEEEEVLRAGDRIVSVNDQQVKGMSIQQFKDLLKGELGGDTMLLIARGGCRPFTVKLSSKGRREGARAGAGAGAGGGGGGRGCIAGPEASSGCSRPSKQALIPSSTRRLPPHSFVSRKTTGRRSRRPCWHRDMLEQMMGERGAGEC
uniref:PDZ domain-containing protein n=1 Tax=Hanusia phi TaxID=3032 RepID=A0A7S0EII9_9CRYP|mmetsp:Transcript_24239/g.54506  ORF Transcript_24239/g.54506 Transcript_24239/m.54506 type:complete len:960 (+) Transcript_24239:233-3112(+)